MFNATRVSKHFGFAALVSATVLFAASVVPARAEVGEERVMVTFDRPVEVPGHVLPPGSYVFKTMENNDIVQIFSSDERKFYTSALVVPEDRPTAQDADSTFVQLNKTKSGAPQEVDSYYVAGRTVGYQLVYPAAHVEKHTK